MPELATGLLAKGRQSFLTKRFSNENEDVSKWFQQARKFLFAKSSIICSAGETAVCPGVLIGPALQSLPGVFVMGLLALDPPHETETTIETSKMGAIRMLVATTTGGTRQSLV